MIPILVVDRSRAIRETLQIVLGNDYEVIVAESAAAAGLTTAPALLILGLAGPDDVDAVHTLLQAQTGTPALFLHAEREVDPALLAPGARRTAFLPKPFDGHALRGAVRDALAAPRAADRRSDDQHVLQHPYLTLEAEALLRRAAAVDAPLLFVGERGTGALAIARALHRLQAGAAPLRAVPAADLTSTDIERLTAGDGWAAFIDDVHALRPEAQHALLLAIGGGRLYASTRVALDAATAGGTFLPELAYALGALTVVLPPLRERGDELPAVIEHLAAAVAARLGRTAVRFTDAALDRLRHYLWFGNTDELDSVLVRSLAGRSAALVDVRDLEFVPGRPTVAVATDRPQAAPSPPSPRDSAPQLEVLLGELAHELRNPMVTIKTFSQHLDSVLEDPDTRARFSTLTADAVGRMDRLLEQLLEFARFRAPNLAATELGPLVDEALAEQREEMTRRQVRLERNGAVPGPVSADRAQVLFALRSLLGGLVPELQPHEPLKMTVPESGTIELEAHAEPATTSRLTAFVEGAETETAETPTLPFALAATLLERNGGSLHVRSGADGATVIRVALDPVEA